MSCSPTVPRGIKPFDLIPRINPNEAHPDHYGITPPRKLPTPARGRGAWGEGSGAGLGYYAAMIIAVIGLIAEEVAEVYPELVQRSAATGVAESVNYPALVAVLIEGFKAQQGQLATYRTAWRLSSSSRLCNKGNWRNWRVCGHRWRRSSACWWIPSRCWRNASRLLKNPRRWRS
jgi:hypothetical protein